MFMFLRLVCCQVACFIVCRFMFPVHINTVILLFSPFCEYNIKKIKMNSNPGQESVSAYLQSRIVGEVFLA